jgi:hypothetical protein
MSRYTQTQMTDIANKAWDNFKATFRGDIAGMGDTLAIAAANGYNAGYLLALANFNDTGVNARRTDREFRALAVTVWDLFNIDGIAGDPAAVEYNIIREFFIKGHTEAMSYLIAMDAFARIL